MKQRSLIIGSVSLLFLAIIVAWFLMTYERVEREIDLPPRGEARYNPLYALKKTLQARDIETTSRADLNLVAMALAPGDLLLLDVDVRNIPETQVGDLLQWVERGGHLAFRLPEGDEGRPGELLDSLSLGVKHEFSCLSWSERAARAAKPANEAEAAFDKLKETLEGTSAERDETAGMLCTAYRFTTDADYESDFDWLWGNREQGYVFGRHPWGEGDVLIASEFDFLHNGELEKGGNAALTWQLLGPALGAGRAFLVYATETPPWHVLLVRQGWYVLLPLMLALLGWLWALSQRLGPVLPLAARHQRAVLAHVQAAGEFAFARHRGAALHAAVLRAFRARLRRRDPVTAALALDPLVQTLSERHQIPASRVRQALQPQELARPEHFLAAIRTLMQLRAVI